MESMSEIKLGITVWVARDKDGELHMFLKEPNIATLPWTSNCGENIQDDIWIGQYDEAVLLDSNLFPGVLWGTGAEEVEI